LLPSGYKGAAETVRGGGGATRSED